MPPQVDPAFGRGPRRDLRSIMVLGSGPIVIGQASEFDYSGTQAIKALRQEGYRIILVNSNPATIMTDPELADATYIEPLTVGMVERVIAAEMPDALLPTVGGQTALNLALELAEAGVLERHGVELIGASVQSVRLAEDRELFKQAMSAIGLETPRSLLLTGLDQVEGAMTEIPFPMILRASFTLGGAGSGVAHDEDELREILREGLNASPVGSVLVEESVLGWKEYELEVIRDRAGNGIVVCSIENFDAMGVHTGDSVTVAPAQTLTDREYQRLRDESLKVLDAVGVVTGGSNVQFAVDPETGRTLVIEMNPPRQPQQRPGQQGHGLSHRQGGRPAGGGLHPARTAQRDHRLQQRLLRAQHRLHRGQGAALVLREVPRHPREAGHQHAVGGRGHGYRSHIQRSAAEEPSAAWKSDFDGLGKPVERSARRLVHRLRCECDLARLAAHPATATASSTDLHESLPPMAMTRPTVCTA